MFPRSSRLIAVLLGVCALILSAAAGPAGAAIAPSRTSSPATVTGPITELGGSWFTLQTSGRRVGVINALNSAATQITDENMPYVWGGGHAEAGVASVGDKGPGHNGKRTGFDCSGAVAAVLADAGLWPSGAGVPADSGVISELLSEHLIARGVGSAPDAVTLYDDPGEHIFMNINGHFFGTSDGGGSGDPAGGAGWLDDGAPDASSPAYMRYHFLPAVLAQQTSYGNDFTFQLPASGLFAATQGDGLGISLGELDASDLLVGERVRVAYSTNGTGEMVLTSVAVISGGPTLTPPTLTPPTTSAPATTTTTTPTPTTPTTTTPTVPASPPTVSVSSSPLPTSGGDGGAGLGSGVGASGGAPLG
jgi:cell division septation protein DedD